MRIGEDTLAVLGGEFELLFSDLFVIQTIRPGYLIFSSAYRGDRMRVEYCYCDDTRRKGETSQSSVRRGGGTVKDRVKDRVV